MATHYAQCPDRQETAAFALTASVCPQLLCRVLGYVAQQARPVDAFSATRRGDRQHIAIRLSGIDAHRAEVLAEKMRMIVEVESVVLRVG